MQYSKVHEIKLYTKIPVDEESRFIMFRVNSVQCRTEEKPAKRETPVANSG